MKMVQDAKNQGMSLVELLVSVAVLGIAMIGILALMNLSTKYYSNSSKEVEVQQELQSTFAMISNMLVDANSYVQFNSSSHTARIANKSKKYVVKLDGSKLYAKEYGLADSEDDLASAENLLADHIQTFSLDVTHYDDGYVTLAMKSKYGNREAAMSKNVFLRNSGKEKADFLGQCDTSVTAGTPSTKTVYSITNKTDAAVGAGTEMVIKVKLASQAGQVTQVAGTGLSNVSYSYNVTTGIVTVHCKVGSGGWAKNATIKITVTGPTATISGCRVLSVGK